MAAAKLLLVQDVEGLGRSGELVSVKPGYARNFLVPKKKAVIADKNTIRKQARLVEERNQRALVERQESEAIRAKIDGADLVTYVKVDHEGHLYGSVTQHDVLHLLESVFEGIALERRYIQLKQPIRETGVFSIEIRLKEGVVATITLRVISEHERDQEENV